MEQSANILFSASGPQKRKLNNLSGLLRMICTGRAVTRTALAQRTKYSKMTISNMVNELIGYGYVSESDESDSSNPGQGRKPAIIELASQAPFAAGVYIGRDSCTVVLSDLCARIIKHIRLPVDRSFTSDSLLDALFAAYEELTQGCNRRICGIGIASIGPIDKANGVILNPPNFYGMQDIPVVSYFYEKTGLPIAFDNNMNGAVLAEKLFGLGRDFNNLIYLGVLNGIGAGVITNNHLLNGSTGISGEVGHTTIKFDGPQCFCGKRGCLELYASLPVVVQGARENMCRAGGLKEEETFDWDALLSYARDGEYYSLRALDELCDYLAVGISDLVNLFDCDLIILGHDIVRAQGLVEERLMDRINSSIFSRKIRRVTVKMSSFGENAPEAGSVSLILYELFKGRIPLD